MESASEAPSTMAGGDAAGDPSLSSAPPPAPPPSSSASTKRRWSPCTWRYAIEEAQTELPSRPRAATVPLAAAASPHSSSRALPAPSGPSQPAVKAKPPHHNPLYGKAAEEAPRSSYAPRPQPLTEISVRSLPSQQPMASKSRAGDNHRLSNRKSHHVQLSKTRLSEGEEEDEDEVEQDVDDDNDDDDDGRTIYNEEYFKRRLREMSPSELYFCPICSAKGNNKGSPCPNVMS